MHNELPAGAANIDFVEIAGSGWKN